MPTHETLNSLTPTDKASENTREKSGIGLSPIQIIASAITAVIATVAGSYLGISGTVIGAAVASVLTVTGNAVFGHSLRRGTQAVRDVVPITVIREPTRHSGNYSVGKVPPTAAAADRERLVARASIPVDADTVLAHSDGPPHHRADPVVSVDPIGYDPNAPAAEQLAAISARLNGTAPLSLEADWGPTSQTGRTPSFWSSLSWPKVAAAVVALFVGVMGTVTVVELVAHKPLAAVVTDKPGSGTSFGGSAHTGTDVSPTAEPTATPTSTVAPSTGSTPSPEATPSPQATVTPSPQATAAPTPEITPTPPAAAPSSGGAEGLSGAGSSNSAVPSP